MPEFSSLFQDVCREWTMLILDSREAITKYVQAIAQTSFDAALVMLKMQFFRGPQLEQGLHPRGGEYIYQLDIEWLLQGV
jgi:hypothetical protein